LSESEVKTLIEKDAIIAHCPNSNRFLISGLMPLINYLKLGANVAIGTDVAGGFYLSMFKEAREAIESSKTYKIFYGRSCKILDVRKAFRLTNIDAAKSLKIDKEIGNFKIGADADLLVINNPYVNGIYDLDTILSKLIYTCEPNHILATYIRGENYSANKVSKY